MDNIVLNGPNGSSINVGSFLLYDPGADFGEADLLKAAYSENPAAEGGYLAFETVNVRRMSFPMRLASVGAFGGVNGLQGWLRQLARPGATLDVQLEGVASSEAVRFDVLTGRLEEDYDPRQYAQLDRIPANLKVDVQPFGYWPTMILLASAASVGGPGVLALDTTKIIGDVPGPAEIFISPTQATSYKAIQLTDAAYWSLGARASFQAFWPAASALAFASAAGLYVPTLLGEPLAPGSQTIRYFSPSAGGADFFSRNPWQNFISWVIPPSLEPAYRGRKRAYIWARHAGPSSGLSYYASLDVQPGTSMAQSLASAAPIATIPAGLASNPAGFTASPAFSFIDLGEVTLPPVASQSDYTSLRLWIAGPTSNPGFAGTTLMDVAGLYLQPVDSPAGILTRGFAQPSTAVAFGGATPPGGRFLHSAVTNDTIIATPTSVIGSIGPLAAAAQNHRGVLPLVGASTLQLDLTLSGKMPSAPIPIRSDPHYASVSVRYRPRFTFMKGI